MLVDRDKYPGFTLHSTMSLLKPVAVSEEAQETVFTFHYVSIKTRAWVLDPELTEILYIPLCLY